MPVDGEDEAQNCVELDDDFFNEIGEKQAKIKSIQGKWKVKL